MICNGCWACNKRVYVQSYCHHFTIWSDSLKKVSRGRPAPARASRHFLTSAFTSHFNWKHKIWQSTQKTIREGSSSLLQNCLTGVNSDSFRRLQSKTVRWKSKGKLSNNSLQYFIQEGVRTCFLQQDFSPLWFNSISFSSWQFKYRKLQSSMGQYFILCIQYRSDEFNDDKEKRKHSFFLWRNFF